MTAVEIPSAKTFVHLSPDADVHTASLRRTSSLPSVLDESTSRSLASTASFRTTDSPNYSDSDDTGSDEPAPESPSMLLLAPTPSEEALMSSLVMQTTLLGKLSYTRAADRLLLDLSTLEPMDSAVMAVTAALSELMESIEVKQVGYNALVAKGFSRMDAMDDGVCWQHMKGRCTRPKCKWTHVAPVELQLIIWNPEVAPQ